MSDKKEKDDRSFHEKMMDKKFSHTELMKQKIDSATNLETKQSYRMIAVVRMAALGWSTKQIAEYIGLSVSRVSAILGSKSAKEQIYKLQQELFTKDPQKMFMDILPDAVNTARRIMKSKKTSAGVRTDAAFKFMDRALGKPVQEIKHEGNALRELFMALDKKNRGEDDKESNSDVIDAEFKEVSSEVKSELQKDPLDNWLDENL